MDGATFESAHASWLRRFDELMARQRAIHEDWSHVNPKSKEQNALVEEINACHAELFRLKDVRATYEHNKKRAEKS